DAELARPGAQFAPLLDVLAAAVEVDNAGVAVAVGDEDVARWRDGHVGGLVEVARVPPRDALCTARQGQLALPAVLLPGVVGDVRHPDVALRVDPDVVGGLDRVLAPGADEVPLRVVDLHWRRAAREDVHAVVAIDGDAGHVPPAGGRGLVRPGRIDRVAG